MSSLNDVDEMPHMVCVYVRGVGRSRAVCNCGWGSKSRLFKGMATMDAQEHAAQTGHAPGIPLVRTSKLIGRISATPHMEGAGQIRAD
ncbi:MAG: hypothetical protein JWR37_4647 [Mycobacterium sp.]|nr:hypothetical protein [Mycobacterium sp.]